MDYIIENESNSTSNLTSYRIATTAACGIAVLVASLILIITLCVKAYRSILQRFFMWFVLAILVNSSCNVASVLYKFHHGDTVIEVNDRACRYLGFLLIWTSWCVCTINMAVMLYLVIFVLTTTRNCPACVVKIRHSRQL